MFTIENFLRDNFDGLKYIKALFNKNSKVLTIYILYNPDIFTLSEQSISELHQKLSSDLGLGIDIKLEFVKSVLNLEVLASRTYMILKNNMPALSKYLTTNDIRVMSIGGVDVDINIHLPSSMKEYATEADKAHEIAELVKNDFFCNPRIIFTDSGVEINDNVIEKNIEFINSIKIPENNGLYLISNKVDALGKNNYHTAIDFSTLKEQSKDIVICGKIKFVNKRLYKKKNEKLNTVEEKPYYTITLSENNNVIYVSCFVQDKDVDSIEKLTVGMSVAMRGYTKDYQGKLSFVANEICMCDYEQQKSEVIYKPVNKDYHIIFPQPFVDAEQIDLFAKNETVDNSNVKGSYVIFDFETTGLNGDVDEIIEVGAVRMEDGKLISTFTTLVKPSGVISEQITNITNIDNEMVKDAENIYNVLPDFYKFCENATLVAYNIDFDYKFLKNVAKKMLYNFDDLARLDALALARQKIKGLPNYKLGTVVQYFGVELSGAHRALNDAIATAKILKKLL